MIKNITIGGKNVVWESSGDIPRLYRRTFGQDVIVQMTNFQKKAAKQKQNVSLESEDIEMFENLAWIYAKHADPDTPDIDTWLRQFEAMDILEAVPLILDLWITENKTTSTLKKRADKSTEK